MDPLSSTPDFSLSDLSRTIQSLKTNQDALMTRLRATESALLHSQQREAHLKARLQEISAWCARLAASQHRTDDELQAQKHRTATLGADVAHLELDEGRIVTVEDAIAEIGKMLEPFETRMCRVERVVSVARRSSDPFVGSPPRRPSFRPVTPGVRSPETNSTTYKQATALFEARNEECHPHHQYSPSNNIHLNPRTTTPLKSQIQHLFTTIENFSSAHLTLHYHPKTSGTLTTAAASILGPTVPPSQIFNSSTRRHLCTGVITRLLCSELLASNPYANFRNPVAKEYTLKRLQSTQYWRLRPTDIRGRGEKCTELAAIAETVVLEPGFAVYNEVEVARVLRLVFAKLLPLVPSASRAVAEDALHGIVTQAFALAVRMNTEGCDYAVKFYSPGDAFADDAMVVLDGMGEDEALGGRGGQAWVVRLCESPVVVEKRFEEELMAEVLVKGGVVVGRKVLKVAKGKGKARV